MINRLPVVTLIQTNDVAVFQTFAVADEANIDSHDSIDNHIDADIAKQQMQQVKTIDNPSGKVPKRAAGVNNATGNEAESAMSSTDHAQ